MDTTKPVQEAGNTAWRRYLELEGERTAITDGCSDLEDPFDRYDQIKAEQAQLRAAMGEAVWRELQTWL